PDGKSFIITFDAYEGTIDPGQAFATRDCMISLDVRTPAGVSFAVESVHEAGYLMLDEPGMTASHTAKYYFTGNPIPARELRSTMTGPYDNSFIFDDRIGVADLVWSPCSTRRRLNAQTRLLLQNNRGKTGSGYAAIGAARSDLRFDIAWRQC